MKWVNNLISSDDLPTEAVLDRGSSSGALLSMFVDVSREKHRISKHSKYHKV